MLQINDRSYIPSVDKARHNTARVFYNLADGVYQAHGTNCQLTEELLRDFSDYIIANLGREQWTDEATTLKHSYQSVKRINKGQAYYKAMCDALSPAKRKGLSREMRQVNKVLEELEDHFMQAVQAFGIESETVNPDVGA